MRWAECECLMKMPDREHRWYHPILSNEATSGETILAGGIARSAGNDSAWGRLGMAGKPDV